MDNIISFSKLSFKYDSNVVFDDFSLDIRRGSFTTILGNNGSGKSTLVRLLLGLLDSNFSISVDGVLLESDSIYDIRKKIGVVFDNPDNCLISETVMYDLCFPLSNLDYSYDDMLSRVFEVSEYLGISDLLNSNPHELSGGEKQLVCLGCALVTNPKIIVLDEALSMVDDYNKENVLKILKRINEDFGITIINITHDIEESMYGTDIVVINDGVVCISDDKVSVYKQEKLLKSIGFSLPFMVDLSNRLSYYDLVDDFVFDMEGLVDLLWK